MTTDEMALRKDAYYLDVLLVELDACKQRGAAPRGERVMKSRPGPSSPANDTALSLDMEIGSELRAWCVSLRDDTDPGSVLPARSEGVWMLARWVATHSFYIAEHLEGETVHAEICRWVHQVENVVGRGPDIVGVASRPERRQTAQSICYRLRQIGHTVSPDLLRKWSERGHITRTTRPDGRGRYLLTEVANHLRGEIEKNQS